MRTYRIETERLVIRPWGPEDSFMLKEAVDSSLDHLRPWLPWAEGEPTSIEERIELLRDFRSQYDRDENHILAILNREETRALGGSGLHPRVGPNEREIGYWVRSGEENRGVVTEAVAAITRVAFEIESFDRLEIRCDPENRPSSRVAEKLGFRHDATLPGRYLTPGREPRDTEIWSLDREEFIGIENPHLQRPFRAFDGAGREI